MKKSRIWRFCLLFLFLGLTGAPLGAQDKVPETLCPQLAAADCDTLLTCRQRTDTVPVPLVTLPPAFREVREIA